MNTSKLRPTGVTSKIPTIKRPVPVGLNTSSSSIIKPTTKPAPSTTQVPATPKHKVVENPAPIKISETKVPPQPQVQSNKENKENLSNNISKKTQQDVKVKGYTELKKSEERLSELVNKFELEKQNFAQQIHALEHKHKNELKAKDEMIRTLKSDAEASYKRSQSAESELNEVQEDLSTAQTRIKTLEAMLERLGVDVISLETITPSVEIEEIEQQYQEFKEVFEEGYTATMQFVKQQAELLACISFENIEIPSVDNIIINSEGNGEEDQEEEDNENDNEHENINYESGNSNDLEMEDTEMADSDLDSMAQMASGDDWVLDAVSDKGERRVRREEEEELESSPTNESGLDMISSHDVNRFEALEEE